MTAQTAQIGASLDRLVRQNRLVVTAVAAVVTFLALFLARQAGFTMTPGQVDIPFLEWVDGLMDWILADLAFILAPLRSGMQVLVDGLKAGLLALHWWFIMIAAFLVTVRLASLRTALFAVVALFAMGAVGMWEAMLHTLALMIVAVLFSTLIAIPLGILAAQSDTFEKFLRPVLDTMQTMPPFVYLIPVVVLFKAGDTAGLVATAIYALPPGVRFTNLGIREVSNQKQEVASSFGATSSQILRTVQLPLAMPYIMMGINQIIMMALSMVVIAALVGAGGLGYEVLQGLDRLRFGQAVMGGMGILLLAILLDRVSEGLSWAFNPPATSGQSHSNRPEQRLWERVRKLFRPLTGNGKLGGMLPAFVQEHAYLFGSLLLLGLLYVLGQLSGRPATFPWHLSEARQIDQLVFWINTNLTFITKPAGDLLFYSLDAVESFLLWLPPALIFAVVLVLSLAFNRYRVGLLTLATLLFVYLQGTSGMHAETIWDLTMSTLALVIVATIIAVGVGVPLGILAARSDRVDSALRPILDGLQVIPGFVYLVPMAMLFGLGNVPALFATVFFAFPPATRLTALGIREVSKEAVEAARSFGSSPLQLLFKIQLPMALPSIMMGINQTIMMVLAMVVIASYIGASGLGVQILTAKSQLWIGRGFEAGFTIVLIAVIIDRLIQSWVQEREAFLKMK